MLHIADLLMCILRLSSFVIRVFAFFFFKVQSLLYPSPACSKLECLAFYVHSLLYLPCKIFITLDKLISCYYITYLTVTLLFPDLVICL